MDKKECIWVRYYTWIGLPRYETCDFEIGVGDIPEICPKHGNKIKVIHKNEAGDELD